ncbi:MAG: hypothetical protein N3D73_02485 [Candidatus Diapherotrites archaeon]|nr:hypothetical protein [Candidatus Diapherotrites archaeon]
MGKRIKESMKRTTVDKWKKKQWYKIIAPKEFGEKEIGETVAIKPEQLIGRTIWISVKDLLNQIKQHYIKIKFGIVDVKGKRAETVVLGHEINDTYLKKFVRRKTSKIELVVKNTSKDNNSIKIKCVVVTAKKADRKKRTAIRKIIKEELENLIKETDSKNIMQAILSDETNKKINDRAKKIIPIKRVELVKSIINKKILVQMQQQPNSETEYKEQKQEDKLSTKETEKN